MRAGRGEIAGAVVVVGGTNVDVEGRVDGPIVPGDSVVGAVRRSAGGVGRNVAECIARLGVPARLISVVGDDDEGARVLTSTAAAGVDVSAVSAVDGATTATYLSVVDGAGEVVAAINDMAVLEHLDAARISAHRDAFDGATAVVVDCNVPPAALTRVVELAAGVPLFVDPVSVVKAPRIGPFLGVVHTIKPNRAELAALTGGDTTTEPGIRDACRRLLAHGAGRVFVSLGGDGVLVMGGGVEHVARDPLPPADRRVASVTGAGDALLAALVVAHVHGLATVAAAEVGIAVATRLLDTTGAAAADLEPSILDPYLRSATR